MTLKERLEQLNKYIEEPFSAIRQTIEEWRGIYPDLIKAVGKAQLYDKMIIASLIKSQEGDQKKMKPKERWIKFNLNHYVKVKLTNFGKTQLRKQHLELFNNLNRYVPYKEAKEEDGWSEWQLWDLMERLGQYCHLGMANQPFEPNIQIQLQGDQK